MLNGLSHPGAPKGQPLEPREPKLGTYKLGTYKLGTNKILGTTKAAIKYLLYVKAQLQGGTRMTVENWGGFTVNSSDWDPGRRGFAF